MWTRLEPPRPLPSLGHHPSVSRAYCAQSLRISNAWRILTSGVAAQAFLQTFTNPATGGMKAALPSFALGAPAMASLGADGRLPHPAALRVEASHGEVRTSPTCLRRWRGTSS